MAEKSVYTSVFMGSLFVIPFRLTADYRYCRSIVRSQAENFPVASLLAPRAIRPHLWAIYAFARTADDFADLPGRSEEERLRLLDDWCKRLDRALEGQAEHPIFRALAHTLHATGIPASLLRDLLSAFRQDVTQKRYANAVELLDYCRRSANPVGRIVLHLDGQDSPENLEDSDAFCTALQLLNHWQDLGDDTFQGRPLYLPQDEMARFGVEEELVVSRRFSPALGGLLLAKVEETRELFLRAEPLLDRLEGRLRLELILTWHAGMRLLEKIEELGGNTLRERPRLDGRDWLRCFWLTLRRATAP